jgi:hypothetical protein
MNKSVRRLNSAGIKAFENWILSKEGDAPKDILWDENFSEPLHFDFEINPTLKFDTTFELGCYLHNSVFINIADPQALFGDAAMWAWISLALIQNLTSKSTKGGGAIGRPLALNHYLQLETGASARQSYRLIVRSVWWTIKIHGASAQIAFGSKESPWGEHAEQILGRQELASHPGFFAVAKKLYLTDNGTIKAGAAGKRSKVSRKNPKAKAGLGAMRRLAQTLNQFSKTYNTRAISVDKILGLLPNEYSRFNSVN